MTATVTGAYVDSTSQSEIEAQLLSLGVASSEVVVIQTSASKVYLGKVVIT